MIASQVCYFAICYFSLRFSPPSLLIFRVPKWLKLLAGLALIPVCLGGLRAVLRVIQFSSDAETIAVALIGGAACWLVVFFLLPKPMWVYVLGHELTHAVWTWLFGGRVKKLKVRSKGGHVIISKTNFLIALAPYFFPLYALLVVVVYLIGHLLFNWHPYRVWFHFLLGAAYSFHLTLTFYVLRTRQSDITDHGYLFSGVIILLGNLTVLMLGLPLLTGSIPLARAAGWWMADTGRILVRLGNWF